jgi:type VI protein secretion system component VasK
MKLRNPWFEWLSFLVGLALSGAAWIAVRDYWRGERDLGQAVLMATIGAVLAIGAFWISLRWGQNQKRIREWRLPEGDGEADS